MDRRQILFGVKNKRSRLELFLPLLHNDGLVVEEPLNFGLGLASVLDVPDQGLAPLDHQVPHCIADDEGLHEPGFASHLEDWKVEIRLTVGLRNRTWSNLLFLIDEIFDEKGLVKHARSINRL